MSSNQYIQTDYERAKTFYSLAPPTYVGRFTMAQENAQTLPISLEAVYETVFEAIRQEPGRAQAWAKTFGTLSVMVALDDSSSAFQFANSTDFKPPNAAEIATSRGRSLSETLYAPEIDASTTFLLANDTPVTAEMTLIQALHMVDTALVTSQFDGAFPLVLSGTTEELTKLRADFPETLLRSYGNVRQMKSVLTLLGTVVPTSVLEKSGIATSPLNALPKSIAEVQPQKTELCEREPAAFVGITTAKKPHIGHGFLLAKAMAEVGAAGKILVEFNDRGPRVVQALANLATTTGDSLAVVADKVSTGSIGYSEIEAAYKSRGSTDVPEIPPDFNLAAPNAYYRELLQQIMPPDFLVDSIADSELGVMQPNLEVCASYLSLFDGAGMALLKGANDKAMVAEQTGSLTVGGLLAVLSTRYSLTLVDSPAPLSAVERKIFKDIGLEIAQSSGVGVMIDFGVASGTNGNTVKLDDLLQIIDAERGKAQLLLPAIRLLMNDSCFLPSDGGSVSPNFASAEALVASFNVALTKVAAMDNAYELLYEPLQLKDIKRELVQDLLAPLMPDGPQKGKPTFAEVKTILDYLPSLQQRFSDKFLKKLDAELPSDKVIPKIFLEENDRQIIQALRSGTPDKVIGMLLELAEQMPDQFETIVNQSKLQDIAQTMGYDSSDMVNFLRKLAKVKGVYRIV